MNEFSVNVSNWFCSIQTVGCHLCRRVTQLKVASGNMVLLGVTPLAQSVLKVPLCMTRVIYEVTVQPTVS